MVSGLCTTHRFNVKQTYGNVEVSGQSPFCDKRWMKETLINALIKLENMGKKKAFIRNDLEARKTTYGDASGIYRMYNKWKQNKVLLGRGRPSALTIDAAVDAVRAVLQDCSNSSSAFKLQDMKDVYAEKKREQAEKDGLDPDSINQIIVN